jgi:hypothetical protein
MKQIPALALALITLALPGFAQSPATDTLKLGKDEAFVILNNLPLYQEQGGSLKWKENLTIGDKVQVKGGVQKKKVEGKERDYLRVKAPSGSEGFVRAQYVAAKATLAVVRAEKATVYSEPRDVKITTKSVSNMTIVATFQDGSTSSFSKIICYDAAQDAYFTDPVYVAIEDLSFADADVNATILYATAAASKNKEIKSNLFKVIQKRYASSIFFDKIQAALTPGAASDAAPAAAKQTSTAAGSFTVNDDKVNVRAQPDETGGQVLTQLSKGQIVEVLEQTTQTYVVGGVSDHWYRIANPAGWVFGGFLDSAE